MFRFGVVASQARDADEWLALARRAEDLGYATFLVPDNLALPAPVPAATAAATATADLHVGTFVTNCAFRPPAQIAWEAASADFLCGGGFELGLGAGRPDAVREAALLGLPFEPFDERLRRVQTTVDALEDLYAHATAEAGEGAWPVRIYRPADRARRPRVLIAGSGKKMLGLAARRADTVALGLPPTAGEDDFRTKLATLNILAGDRFDDIELNVNLAAVGEPPPWLARLGLDPAKASDNAAMAVLSGSPQEIADLLRRRRDDLGISYVTVNAAYADALAPVVERLTGT